MIGIWIFSGLLVLCGALTLAELGTLLPESGGLYVYMLVESAASSLMGLGLLLVGVPFYVRSQRRGCCNRLHRDLVEAIIPGAIRNEEACGQ